MSAPDVIDRTQPITIPSATPPRSGESSPTRHARPRSAPGVLVVVAGFLALGLVMTFFAVYALWFSALQEQRSQHQLYSSFRGLLDPSSPDAPAVGGVIRPGTPVALLNSPQADLRELVVVEGTSSGDLSAGPGHVRATPLPGQAGESILVGKSVTSGAPFAGIDRLEPGDIITARTGQGRFEYRVDDIRNGGQQPPEIASGGSLLTLVTSSGSGLLGRLTPNQLIYVDATLQGKVAPTPSARPDAVPAPELPGGSDSSAWPAVVFWLQGLLLASGGAVWLSSRWGTWRSWLVTVPVLFGVLWGVSVEVMRLLPNVF